MIKRECSISLPYVFSRLRGVVDNRRPALISCPRPFVAQPVLLHSSVTLTLPGLFLPCSCGFDCRPVHHIDELAVFLIFSCLYIFSLFLFCLYISARTHAGTHIHTHLFSLSLSQLQQQHELVILGHVG